MIKCRQRAGRRGGRQRWREKREGKGETEKRGFNFFNNLSHSDVPAPSWSQPFGIRPFWANTEPWVSHSCHNHCPGLGPRCHAGVVTQVTCPCQQQANKSKQPAQRFLQNNSTPPHESARAQHPGAALRDCQTPTSTLSGCKAAGARASGVALKPSRLPSRFHPTVAQAPGSSACSSPPSLWAPSWCHSNFSFYTELTEESEEKMLWPSRYTEAQGVEKRQRCSALIRQIDGLKVFKHDIPHTSWFPKEADKYLHLQAGKLRHRAAKAFKTVLSWGLSVEPLFLPASCWPLDHVVSWR